MISNNEDYKHKCQLRVSGTSIKVSEFNGLNWWQISGKLHEIYRSFFLGQVLFVCIKCTRIECIKIHALIGQKWGSKVNIQKGASNNISLENVKGKYLPYMCIYAFLFLLALSACAGVLTPHWAGLLCSDPSHLAIIEKKKKNFSLIKI